jgi:hypothetical protein
MDETWSMQKPFLVLIVKRLTIFFLILVALALFYWCVGSFQRFLDETQYMLLGILRWSAIGLTSAAAGGFVASTVFALFRRFSFTFLGILGYFLASLIGIAGLLVSDLLRTLSRGLQ